MHFARVALITSSLALVPFGAQAASKTKERKPEASAEKAGEEQPAKVETPVKDQFKIRRGFFAEGDLGVFLTFGGVNANNPSLPKRATSNLQPHIGVTLGYDLSHGPKYDFSLGLRFGMGLSGGASRATPSDAAAGLDVATRSNDFSVIETGLQAAFSYLLTDRLGLVVKADGGAGLVDPDPTRYADDAKAGKAAFAPIFGVGTGLEYYTLLTDFSMGVTFRFEGVLLGGLIPAASVTLPVKYTF